MDNIHTNMEYIFENGSIKRESKDIELSKRLEKTYGVDVLCSEFSFVRDPFGKMQGNFSFMVDTRKSKNDAMKSLHALIGAGNYGAQISLPTFGECFRKFAEIAVTEYLKILGLERNNYDEMYVTVHEFKAKAINYLYGKSFQEVREFLHNKFHIDKRDIIGMEDSKYYVLIDDLDDFVNVINHKTDIVKIVFEIMKKYDHFNFFKHEELKISFFLKQALDYEMLSGFLQLRVLF